MHRSPHPALSAVVIGGGPAGLMAAEALLDCGIAVDLFDSMPSVGRKLLMAGRGGLNITHSEPLEALLGRYGGRRPVLEPHIHRCCPESIREWMRGLGIASFVGSSGRVFPEGMKAAPLLRAWLHRLRSSGLRMHVRHRWLGWHENGDLRFVAPAGEVSHRASAVVLALGGGSWAKLGSDGAWVPVLSACGVDVNALKPANCGFDLAWSEHFMSRFAGQPLKSVAARPAGWTHWRRGEFVVSRTGVEGSLIYALAAPLRDAIEIDGSAVLHLDLLPDHTPAKVESEVRRPRGARSLSSHLQSRLGLQGVKAALLREVLGQEGYRDANSLAHAIKCLPLTLRAPRPLDEAISSAGGVRFEELDEHLMLRRLPGVFCAGEMLDWEAPTGGYLLTACLATGRSAGLGASAWLRR